MGDHPLSTAITSRLEAELIKLALEFGRAVINVKQPRSLALDGPDTRFLEEYLKHALAILLLQGAPYFDEHLREHPTPETQSDPASSRRVYYLESTAKLTFARGHESPHGFTVLEGSLARR